MGDRTQLIMRVWKAKTSGQKLVSIPKKHEIQEGDYVEIRKV